MRHFRVTTLAVASVLAAPLVVLGTATGSAAATCDANTSATGDVDGDGQPDLVVGVPKRSNNAGGVDLRMTTAPSRVMTRGNAGFGTSTAGDRFGAAVALADLNFDGCDDVIVGAPGVGGDAGRAYIALGAPSGFESSGGFTLDQGATAGDAFGSAVAVARSGEFDGYNIWVGAPNDDVAGAANSGSIAHYVASSTSTLPGGVLSLEYVETIRQNTAGVPGGSESGDHFGAVLAANHNGAFTGTPDEDIGKRSNAGSATLLKANGADGGFNGFNGAQAWSQESPGVTGSAEAGDHFGAAMAIVGDYAIVGIPGENLGSKADAGMVQTFKPDRRHGQNGDLAPRSALTQDSHVGTVAVPGAAEAGDHFGAAVLLGRGLFCTESVDMAVGVPGEDLTVKRDSKHNAGTVDLIPLLDPCGARAIDQKTALPGKPQDGDHLGKKIGLKRSPVDESVVDQVFIGVPGENVGSTVDAGIVQLSPFRGNGSVSIVVAGSSKKSVGYSGGASTGFHYGSVIAMPPDGD